MPERQRDSLAAYLDSCRIAAPAFRWVAPGNLHLTLRFLGNVAGSGLDILAGALREIAVEPFELQLGELGTFGGSSSVRVIWLGPEVGADSLLQLARKVEERCTRIGFAPEDRPYHPHLTLARSGDRRGERSPSMPPPPDLGPWTVTGFQLYRSRLGKGGAAYSVIADFGS